MSDAARAAALGTKSPEPTAPPTEVREVGDDGTYEASHTEMVMTRDLIECGFAREDAFATAGSLSAALTAAGYPPTPIVRTLDGDTETLNGPFARRTRLGYPALGWTCFHCGETFTTPGAARDHFGCDQSDDPACRIKVGEERGLVMELRKAEAEIRRLCSEEKDYQEHVAQASPIVAGQTVGPGMIAVPLDHFADAGKMIDLIGALTEMVGAFRPFVSKPCGAEGSPVRLEQEAQIAAHRRARAMLSALKKETGR